MLISKYIKKFGLVLVGLCSLMLAGCGLGSDKLSTGFYKEAAINLMVNSLSKIELMNQT